MSNLNYMDAFEKYTSYYSRYMLRNAIRSVGTTCTVMRKKKDRATDKVYGVYAGSELSRTPSSSIYDKPITDENIDEIDLFAHNLGEATNFDLMESIDDSFEELFETKVLLNSMTWRVISNQSASLLEDPGYVYCVSEEESELEHGDILVIKNDGKHIKFKAYYPERIGNLDFHMYRFKVTNVQE